ncbi:hypothetical protein OBBRIDRAFT_506799 [Obba rivulosa]|uniref:Uncharacterized protein n=1 Tax=Obba rivulosa TaxID=1052685 RepID=A0A8E2DM82_9APHY|nr:hypothetical protein OBBRIDRAFT_506799 [Obba rivulosa]
MFANPGELDVGLRVIGRRANPGCTAGPTSHTPTLVVISLPSSLPRSALALPCRQPSPRALPDLNPETALGRQWTSSARMTRSSTAIQAHTAVKTSLPHAQLPEYPISLRTVSPTVLRICGWRRTSRLRRSSCSMTRRRWQSSLLRPVMLALGSGTQLSRVVREHIETWHLVRPLLLSWTLRAEETCRECTAHLVSENMGVIWVYASSSPYIFVRPLCVIPNLRSWLLL